MSPRVVVILLVLRALIKIPIGEYRKRGRNNMALVLRGELRPFKYKPCRIYEFITFAVRFIF